MTTTGTIKITRVFEDPYTHVENAILRDTRMSLATRGFFALCLGLKQNQALTVGYFAKVAGVNKDTVVKHFQVLEKLGYLRRRQEHDEAGKFSATIYEFFTRPEEEPYPKNSDTDTVSEKTVSEKTVSEKTVSEKTVTGFFRTKEITKEVLHADKKRTAALLARSGISFDTWLTFERDTVGLKSSKDANGKDIKGQTRQDKVWRVIDGYRLSKSQKNAMHFAAGYKESSLKNAPWA